MAGKEAPPLVSIARFQTHGELSHHSSILRIYMEPDMSIFIRNKQAVGLGPGLLLSLVKFDGQATTKGRGKAECV